MGGYTALIPLRRGSRGIPGKNRAAVAGKPLCLWVVEAALAAPSVGEVYVATDDPEVVRLLGSLRAPRLRVVGRSAASAADTAPTEHLVAEFLAAHPEVERVVLLQATSPLTRPEDIEGALARHATSGAESLLTVVRLKRFLWREGPAGAVPLNYDPRRRPRRQDVPGLLVENGALYVFTREGFLRTGSRLHGRVALYEMPPESFVEVDEPADLLVAAALLRGRRDVRSEAPATPGAAARSPAPPGGPGTVPPHAPQSTGPAP